MSYIVTDIDSVTILVISTPSDIPYRHNKFYTRIANQYEFHIEKAKNAGSPTNPNHRPVTYNSLQLSKLR
jgi:hypothetical protein